MAPALIVKLPKFEPAGMVMESGTVSIVGTVVVNETGMPPAGAGLLSWIVQTALVFGVRVLTEQVSEMGPGALATMEIITALLLPPKETVTVVT
jgi:hypothetical protein